MVQGGSDTQHATTLPNTSWTSIRGGLSDFGKERSSSIHTRRTSFIDISSNSPGISGNGARGSLSFVLGPWSGTCRIDASVSLVGSSAFRWSSPIVKGPFTTEMVGKDIVTPTQVGRMWYHDLYLDRYRQTSVHYMTPEGAADGALADGIERIKDMTTGRVELGNEDVSFIRRMANSLLGCIKAQGRDHRIYPPMPAPPVQVDVPDPPTTVREKEEQDGSGKAQRTRRNAISGVESAGPIGCDTWLRLEFRPRSPPEFLPRSPSEFIPRAPPLHPQCHHPSSYYDPRSTYHQSPPNYHKFPYDSRPVYPPSPRQQYYDSRPVYPQDPPTSSGTWHDGSSTTAPHEFTPWTCPHQSWPPTPHRMSADVPTRPRKRRLSADTAPTSATLPRPFETCHRNHLLLLPSAVVQGARKSLVPVKLVDFLEMYFELNFNYMYLELFLLS
ncbi:unnamed protein product [Linum trigynum]|uniref:Uncharacterized protein n=1 Tax=Linum trigynum TaxID=586398 RepID=A0AAV2D5J5_9ROSI